MIYLTARCARTGNYLTTLRGTAEALAGLLDVAEAEMEAKGIRILWTST